MRQSPTLQLGPRLPSDRWGNSCSVMILFVNLIIVAVGFVFDSILKLNPTATLIKKTLDSFLLTKQRKQMKIQLFFLPMFLPSCLFAQHFKKAPKLEKPVHKIIEWKTIPRNDNSNPLTVKGYVYEFDRKGNPILFKNHSGYGKEEIKFKYDNQGRMVQRTYTSLSQPVTEKYTYGNGYRVTKSDVPGLEIKNIEYFNDKNQIVEEKMYIKSIVFDMEEMELATRKIFNYDDRDSLFGVMEYSYENEKIKSKEKTIIYYNSKNGKKGRMVSYDKNGKEDLVVQYLYNKNDQLAIINRTWPTSGDRISEEIRRKNGKLWQHIRNEFGMNERFEKVYKNGKWIRYKEYFEDELLQYTDFQYIYY